MNKYTAESIIKALRSTNGMCSLAAKKLGCTLATIHNRAHANPKIRQAIEDARSEMIDIAEQKLKQAILNGEPWAIAMTLKTIGKHRGYSEGPNTAIQINTGSDLERPKTLIDFYK